MVFQFKGENDSRKQGSESKSFKRKQKFTEWNLSTYCLCKNNLNSYAFKPDLHKQLNSEI